VASGAHAMMTGSRARRKTLKAGEILPHNDSSALSGASSHSCSPPTKTIESFRRSPRWSSLTSSPRKTLAVWATYMHGDFTMPPTRFTSGAPPTCEAHNRQAGIAPVTSRQAGRQADRRAGRSRQADAP
jgi:hypothetical protein